MMDIAQRQTLRTRLHLQSPDVAAVTTREGLALLDCIDEIETGLYALFNPSDGCYTPLLVNILRGSVETQGLARRLLSEEDVQKLDGWESLRSERDDANALLFSIKSMKFDADEKRWHGDCDLKGALVHYLCMTIYEHFVECGGVNYVEQSVFHPPTSDAFDVLIQRRNGKTPVEVNAELRAENERLKAELETQQEGNA